MEKRKMAMGEPRMEDVRVERRGKGRKERRRDREQGDSGTERGERVGNEGDR